MKIFTLGYGNILTTFLAQNSVSTSRQTQDEKQINCLIKYRLCHLFFSSEREIAVADGLMS